MPTDLKEALTKSWEDGIKSKEIEICSKDSKIPSSVIATESSVTEMLSVAMIMVSWVIKTLPEVTQTGSKEIEILSMDHKTFSLEMIIQESETTTGSMDHGTVFSEIKTSSKEAETESLETEMASKETEMASMEI